MALVPGTSLGPYEIADRIGVGGMGEVYKARDTRLDRPVAIKFLSPHLVDESARRRFQQEAKMASALNHPHILTVHDTGELNGQQYLVTEFVDGGTLKDWARADRRSWRQVVDLLIGVGDGLAAAHAAGILHRDIKPSNILVAQTGYAKLADFGLAKLGEGVGAKTMTRTVTAHTRPGVIVGTIPYMSPEQALGQPLDARADIFSFGVVLYELLCGQRPFRGATDLEVLHAIVHGTTESLPAAVPVELKLVVSKSLEKDPAERYQAMRELVVDLKRIQRRTDDRVETGLGYLGTVPARRRGRRIAMGAIASALLIALSGVWWLWQRDYFWQNPLADARSQRLTDFEGTEADAVISPDGRLIAFYSDRDGQFDAWINQIGSDSFINISKGRLEGDRNLGANPRVGFSGDGTHVWITKQRPRQSYLTWLMPALGGTPRVFLEPGMNPAWSPDGSRIVYFQADPGDPIFIADRNGSNPKQIFVEKAGYHCHFVTWSPDARFIYFTRGVIATDEFDIWRIRVPTDNEVAAEPERITHHNARVGYLSWLDARTLIYSATADDGSGQWLYAIDVEHRIPHRVSSGITERYLSVAVSRTEPHRLVTTVATTSASLWSVSVSDHVQTESAVQRFAVPNTRALGPRFGPDHLLFLSSKGGGDGLWKFQGGAAIELWRGADGGVIAPPAISASGQQVAFSYRSQGRAAVYVMNANGSNARALVESLDVRGAPTWSPDERWIAVAANQGQGTRILKVPVGGGPPVQLVNTTSYNPVWSPDGRFILYFESLQGGLTPIKAVTPDGAGLPLPDLRVNFDGSPFRFVPERNALIYIKEGAVLSGANFYWADLATGQERQLTELKQGFRIASFDVSPDGKQIIFDRLQDHSDIVLMEFDR
jgi:Tol biopolymer transport system component/tRNA A-37 threonylcarbamoyl transferase component Bud32